MRNCEKCLEKVWKFSSTEGWITAECQICGFEVTFEGRKKWRGKMKRKKKAKPKAKPFLSEKRRFIVEKAKVIEARRPKAGTTVWK